MIGWHFKELDAGIVRRTAHEEEFFTSSTKVGAVVREAVQNSIDAKKFGGEAVLIRFYVGRAKNNTSGNLLLGLHEHLNAAGIKVEQQLGSSEIPFLAIEDFHTTGLKGDLDSSSKNAQNGDFYNFWWADGSLKKKGQSGGRWGLGKYTFFVSSKVKTFWGLTVRDESPEKVLMGRSLLKPHSIGDKLYNLDGFFASSHDFNPVLEKKVIEGFESTFQLKRAQETGLSIVVPMPFDEVDADSILKEVLDQYLYSIIRGKVKTEISEQGIDGRNTDIILNKETLMELLKNKKLVNNEVFDKYLNMVKMYEKIEESKLNCKLNILNPTMPEITEFSFGESLYDLRNIYSNLENKKVIKLRVPVQVIEESSKFSDTYYDVIITKSKYAPKKRVLCFRSGILVTDAITLDTEGFAVLLTADDEKIAQFLGDAENPSHTNWSTRSENFNGKYKNGKELLKFIIESPGRILKILKEEPENTDTELLADIFYIEVDKADRTPSISPLDFLPIVGKSRFLEIGKIADGFFVTVKKPEIQASLDFTQKFPFTCRIDVAYMVRSGSPLKKYDSNDFCMSKPPIFVNIISNGDLLRVENNSIVVKVEGEDFKLQAKGFDKNRDLYVRALEIKIGEETDDD